MASRTSAIPPMANPWARLAAAMALQAVRDLQDPDPLKALDALGWFIDDADEILTTLDIWPKGDILEMAVKNGK